VDDGSTDATRVALEQLGDGLRARGILARVIGLGDNQGKAEAVRRGMLEALAQGAGIVGYYDADLSTPPAEMIRLLDVLAERRLDVTLGARVALVGRVIERKASRHYLGRVFATFASVILGIAIYDTQCGAKAFRRTPALEAALAEPFVGRWAFDVELIGRLLAGAPGAPGIPVSAIAEIPLRAWRDVGGSTLGPATFPRVALELAGIARALGRWRAR
jgi:glycosyltransferase involved in cell wall biosynthesis